jgi:hypothetical protein
MVKEVVDRQWMYERLYVEETRNKITRSGDRIPVGERFSATVQIGPGAHRVSWVSGLFRGSQAAAAWR